MLDHDVPNDHVPNDLGRGGDHLEGSTSDEGGGLVDGVEHAIDDRPWVKHLFRTGWIAKGAVYVLMGLTAFTIGRRRTTTDSASPEGALGQIAERTWGRMLLVVFAVGLLFYAVWRLLSVVLVRGSKVRDWFDRLGYLFSAAFYTVLAVSALGAAMRSESPDDPNTVESFSQDLLGSMVGRTILLAAGAVTVAIGLYFIVKKGVKRSFMDELRFEGATATERRAVVWTGVVGWIGRGLVTSAVGWFVLQAAWQADGREARGFDRALRELANTTVGMVVVALSGLALCLYGVFCFLGFRHMDLDS